MDSTVVMNLEINIISTVLWCVSWIPACKNLKGINFKKVDF